MTQDTPDMCHRGAARIMQWERHGSGKDCILNRHLHTPGVIQLRHRWQPGLVPLTQVRFPERKGWRGGGCVQREHEKQIQTCGTGQVETGQKRDLVCPGRTHFSHGKVWNALALQSWPFWSKIPDFCPVYQPLAGCGLLSAAGGNSEKKTDKGFLRRTLRVLAEWVGDWLHPQGGRVSLGYVLVLVRYHHCSCQTHACHQSEVMTHSNREYGPAIM